MAGHEKAPDVATPEPVVAPETAAAEPTLYKVVGPLAVVRMRDGKRKYLNRGAMFPVETADEDHLEHLLRVGLVAPNE